MSKLLLNQFLLYGKPNQAPVGTPVMAPVVSPGPSPGPSPGSSHTHTHTNSKSSNDDLTKSKYICETPIYKSDILTPLNKKESVIVEKLLSVEYPEQRSEQWFKQRDCAITASDGGCVIGVNKYEPAYKFIMKKVFRDPFLGGVDCYNGKKYEDIAILIYEHRYKVNIEEFGLVMHPKYSFLAASPDGIVGKYKPDKKSLTELVGRMVEIKCPTRREIITSGEIKDNICPIYYWVQVQLQLECCNLDKCDFWQCKILEYTDRDEFIADTDNANPFLSIKTGFEKGCLIQLLPKNKISLCLNNTNEFDINKYNETVYEYAKFIYPQTVLMSPYDCDQWVLSTIMKIQSDPEYSEYCFDRIFYWKLIKSHNSTIVRDKKWFSTNLPTYEKMWKIVEFYRTNDDIAQLIKKYVQAKVYGLHYKKVNLLSAEFLELFEYLSVKPTEPALLKKYKDKITQLEKFVYENSSESEESN